jgi:hypothetical protein
MPTTRDLAILIIEVFSVAGTAFFRGRLCNFIGEEA